MLHLDGVELSFGPPSTNRLGLWLGKSDAEPDHTALAWRFDWHFDSSGTYAIMGRSGSGKSTLLNLIGGFLQPLSGHIRWHDQLLNDLPPHERPVTTLFQDNNLFDHLSVAENIGLGVDPGLRLTEEQGRRISEVLASTGLAGYESREPKRLSGGERQRVAVARCLLRNKPILLLDEPFSALDSQTRRTMIDLLQELITRMRPLVIMVTHDGEDAEALQAKRLQMENGRLAGG